MSYDQMGTGGAIHPGGDAGPTRAYYFLAAIILVLGTAFFGLFLFKSIVGMRDGLVQVVAPGARELALDQTGEYTIFHEFRSVIDGRVYGSPPALSGLEVSLKSRDTGEEIALSPVAAGSNYNMGSRSGYGLFSFRIDRPGTYILSSQYRDGREGDETVLAVGRSFVAGLLLTIFTAIGILMGSILTAVLIVVITAIRRAQARQRSVY